MAKWINFIVDVKVGINMREAQVTITSCSQCPHCKTQPTQDAEWAKDYFCELADEMLMYFVEYEFEIPGEIPEWCPLTK